MVHTSRVAKGGAAFAIAALLAAAMIPVAAASPAKTHMIVLDKMKFGAPPPELHVGDTILWVNRDLFRHSATARDGGFDLDLPPARTVRLVLRKPGVIAFFCKFHPGMTGRLKVSR